MTLSAQTYTEIGTKYLGIGLHERNLAVGFRVPLTDVWPLPPNPIPRLVDMRLIYAGVWSSPSKVRFNTTSWGVIPIAPGGRIPAQQRTSPGFFMLGGTFSDWLGTAGCSINWNASAVSAPGGAIWNPVVIP